MPNTQTIASRAKAPTPHVPVPAKAEKTPPPGAPTESPRDETPPALLPAGGTGKVPHIDPAIAGDPAEVSRTKRRPIPAALLRLPRRLRGVATIIADVAERAGCPHGGPAFAAEKVDGSPKPGNPPTAGIDTDLIIAAIGEGACTFRDTDGATVHIQHGQIIGDIVVRHQTPHGILAGLNVARSRKREAEINRALVQGLTRVADVLGL